MNVAGTRRVASGTGGVNPSGSPNVVGRGKVCSLLLTSGESRRHPVDMPSLTLSGTGFAELELNSQDGQTVPAVQSGDMIALDVSRRELRLEVDENSLAARRAKWAPPALPERGWVRLYAEHVLQADKGADFDFLVGSSGAAVARDSH